MMRKTEVYHHMKVVFRGDDIGYSHVHNLGSFKAVDEGMMTHCDVMLDWKEATVEALEFLRERPWISIGWHTHFWGYPVCGAETVPSLTDETGRFKWRRINLMEHPVEGIVFEEVLQECRAQISMCERIAGRKPVTCTICQPDPAYRRAVMQVCDENDIAYHYEGGRGPGGEKYPDEKYRHLNIKEYFTSGVHPASPKLRTELFNAYDPAAAIIDMPLEEDVIWVKSLHPGYLDDLILSEQHCTIHRVKDVQAYCDERVRKWIIMNRIELINQNDMLYGTDGYQNHLREIGSLLCMI